MRPTENLILILRTKDFEIKIRSSKFSVGGQQSTACNVVAAGPKPNKKIRRGKKNPSARAPRGLFRRIGRWFEKRQFLKEVCAIAIGDILAYLICEAHVREGWLALKGLMQAVIGRHFREGWLALKGFIQAVIGRHF
jgi:hypothetical protein